MYQAFDISKTNWSKLSTIIENSRLNTTELNLIDGMFSSVFDNHTDLSSLLFLRKYLFSAIIRIHSFLKDSKKLDNMEDLKDIYDYLITTAILGIEIATEHGIDSGLTWFITRVMNKIFNFESTNSAYVVIDERFSLKQKYIVEPIIASESDRMSLDKAKEFIIFLFNLLSFCDSSNKFVSISIICSSTWIKGFKEIPYLVDDSIISDFSSNPAYVNIINSVLLSRREFMFKIFNGEIKGNFGDFDREEFESNEPESLYDDIKKFVKESNISTIQIDQYSEEDSNIVEDFLPDIVSVEYEDGGVLPIPVQNELSVLNGYLTDLCVNINGSILQSNVDKDNIKGSLKPTLFPRLKLLYRSGRQEDSDITTVMEALYDYEKDKKKKKRKVKNSKKIKNINETIQDLKQIDKDMTEDLEVYKEKIKDLKYSGVSDFTSKSKIFSSFSDVTKFSSYMNDILTTLEKQKIKLSTDMISKIINGYNATKENKILFKNIQKNKETITFDRMSGTSVVDHCVIENGKFKAFPVTEKNLKRKKVKKNVDLQLQEAATESDRRKKRKI